MLGGSKKGSKGKSVARSDGITFIENACRITGDISSKGSITIDGHIDGNVNSESTVLVAEQGSIHGHVTCNELIVLGSIDGNINSQTLHLQPTSKITGDINTQNLHVESGAIYQGAVSMHKNAADTSKSIASSAGAKITSGQQPPAQSSNMVVDAVNVVSK